MKNIFLIMAVLLSGSCFSQTVIHNGKTGFSNRDDTTPKSIFGKARLKGGYVGVSMQAFDINDQIGYGFGGEAAFVISRKVNIGFAGRVLATDIKSDFTDVNFNNYYYEMAFGGLFIEPMIRSKWPVHVSFPTTIGMGGAGISRSRIYDPYWDYDNDIYDADYFFIANPGVNVELNIFRFMRLAGGLNYRISSDFKLGNVTENISGLGGNITLKLGWF